MVSWFHQTELTTVLDLARCEEFRRLLDAHGIPYKVKGKDRPSPWFSLWGGRERTGVFFQNASLDRQYVIYVSRENLSLAQAVTGLEAKR